MHRFPQSTLAGYTNAATKERLSWLDVKHAATHLSTALVKKYGLQPGETVALFSQNTIWYPVAMHAILRVGGKVSGASPAYNVEEMTYALQKGEAKFLMTHPNSMDVATKAAAKAGIPRERLFSLEGKMEGYTTVKELIEMGKREAQQVDYYRIPKGKTNFDICESSRLSMMDVVEILTMGRRFLVFQLGNDWSAEGCESLNMISMAMLLLTAPRS